MTMQWRWVAAAAFMAFALGMLTAASAAGQEIQDSVVVRVMERPQAVTLAGPSLAYRGDVLTFLARVQDQDGNPTLAFLVWSVSDTAKARIISLTDSTASVQVVDTGAVTVRVEVGPLDSLRVGMVKESGEFVWPSDDPENTLRLVNVWDYKTGTTTPGVYVYSGNVVRETGRMCALFFSGSVPWGFTPQEVCYPAYRNRYGLTGAPAGPLRRIAIYGSRPDPGPEYIAQFAALIRSSPPADWVALRRVL